MGSSICRIEYKNFPFPGTGRDFAEFVSEHFFENEGSGTFCITKERIAILKRSNKAAFQKEVKGYLKALQDEIKRNGGDFDVSIF